MKLAIKNLTWNFMSSADCNCLKRFKKSMKNVLSEDYNPSGQTYYDTMLDVYQKDKSVKDTHVFEAGWNAAMKHLKK